MPDGSEAAHEEQQNSRDHTDLRRRLDSLETQKERHSDRIRQVEQALVRLSDLPAAIDRMSERLEAYGRLEDRISHLEGYQESAQETVNHIEEQIQKVEIKLARWGGALAVVLMAIEVVPKLF